VAIPPGISAADWTNARKQFSDVVGSQWVFTSDEDVALYRDAYSPFWGEPEERLVAAAVAPDSAEQVSQIVKIANRYRVPLFAISTGMIPAAIANTAFEIFVPHPGRRQGLVSPQH
jgi:(+)-pinoresinol hydroxylase